MPLPVVAPAGTLELIRAEPAWSAMFSMRSGGWEGTR